MREISLVPYNVNVTKLVDGQVKEVPEPYDIKKSLALVLFHQGQQIPPREAIKRDSLCKKVEDCLDETMLFEEADYQLILKSAECLPRSGRNDVEFLNRIFDAKEVSVRKSVSPSGVAPEALETL